MKYVLFYLIAASQ